MGAESYGRLPTPPSEKANWALAAAVVVLGAGALVAALTGAVGARRLQAPAVAVRTPAPAPAASSIDPTTGRRVFASQTTAGRRRAAIVSRPGRSGAVAGTTAPGAGASGGAGSQGETGGTSAAGGYEDLLSSEVPRSWMEGFYPIYETAEKAFGVNWLLIASIHAQETAFSTARGTYHGLNFAHCCGGPMQFNVTNGSTHSQGTPSTWAQVSDSYRYARRPASYDHMTARHPSIYDDFDSVMAAAHLLSLDGATYALNDAAWWAAYDYYGHDAYGVTYADQVLARAIGWSQHGFCVSCGVSGSLVEAVQAAWGAPVDAELEAEEAAARRRLARAARRRPCRSPRSSRPAACG